MIYKLVFRLSATKEKMDDAVAISPDNPYYGGVDFINVRLTPNSFTAIQLHQLAHFSLQSK